MNVLRLLLGNMRRRRLASPASMSGWGLEPLEDRCLLTASPLGDGLAERPSSGIGTVRWIDDGRGPHSGGALTLTVPGRRPLDDSPLEQGVEGRQNWLEVGALAGQASFLTVLPRPVRSVPADTRMVVADLVRRSTETFTREVRGLFETYLGREPAVGEEGGWVTLLLRGWTEEQVLVAFLDTEEFAQRASAVAPSPTADESFVRAVHGLLLRREPGDAELGHWLAALPNLGRAGLVQVMVSSAEYRRLRVAEFFAETAGRAGSEAEVGAWAASPFPLFAVRQVFETRPDLFQ